MSDNAKRLIAQFRDFRTRKEAMDSLLLMGDAAIPDLIDALAHPMESVRWSARNVLVLLGTEAAVGQLIAALDDPGRAGEAAAALREITGQPLGIDRQAWADWAHERATAAPRPEAPPEARPEPAPEPPAEKHPEPAARPETLSDDELVNAAVRGTEASIGERSGGYVLTVPIERGRRQRVTISFNAKDFEGEPLVVVYTECGPAEAKNFEWALRQNLRMSFGAIGVRDRAGQPTFVMVNTHHRATLTAEDLRKSILLLARKGDALEEMLTKADQR